MSEKKTARFACFHGKSLVSGLIRFVTRSKGYSHVAYLTEDNDLVEPWPTPGNLFMNWTFSDFCNHRPGTIVEIWALEVSEEQFEAIDDFMRMLALCEVPYDYSACAGFVLRFFKNSMMKFFCSEGCVYPLKTFLGWSRVRPEFVSPQNFVELIQAAGAVEVEVERRVLS